METILETAGFGFGFGSELAVFPAVFYGSELPVFCDSGLISRFSDDFSRFRFGTGGLDSRIFEPEPNHGSKINGFSSEKFSRFRFGTVTGGYGFGFNRRFGKPWASLRSPNHCNRRAWNRREMRRALADSPALADALADPLAAIVG